MPSVEQVPEVNWPRVNRGRTLALRLYPDVVGLVLAEELDSWATNGYRFGGRQLIDRLLLHLESLERSNKLAGEDIGVVVNGLVASPAVVHRAEVEG